MYGEGILRTIILLKVRIGNVKEPNGIKVSTHQRATLMIKLDCSVILYNTVPRVITKNKTPTQKTLWLYQMEF